MFQVQDCLLQVLGFQIQGLGVGISVSLFRTWVVLRIWIGVMQGLRFRVGRLSFMFGIKVWGRGSRVYRIYGFGFGVLVGFTNRCVRWIQGLGFRV